MKLSTNGLLINMPFRKVLQGIRVLDLTSNLPGPLATQMLGDFGADVIKVESLQGDNTRHYPPFIKTESVLNLLLNRNKRSIALNIKSKKGLEIFYNLVRTCDVIIESFRPGTTKKLKIDFDRIKELRPDIIYCSITGYGPDDLRSGHDLNYVASTGIIHITGPKELPTPIGVPIADIGGGSLPAVISILAALLQRNKEAQHLNVAITEQLIPWTAIAASTYLAGLDPPKREDHILSGYNPFYRLFRTKDEDDRYISFAPLEAKFWGNFCKAIGREDLIGKQFNFEVLNSELPAIFIQKTQLEWEIWFSENDVPGASVLTIEEALEKKSRLKLTDHPLIGEFPLIASPFLDEDVTFQPAPRLGEHTKEILEELGYQEEIDHLKDLGVIGLLV
ncbi:MAG: CaiB/BaiF CoA transferase family protein [Candidatus Hodarchaeota archaeon]